MSKALTLDEVKHVAKLAHLALADAELEKMQTDLGAILNFMAALEKLDTASVEPTYHAVDMTMQLRPDTVQRNHARAEFLAQAPKVEGPAFAVPKVMEGE